MKMDFQIWNGKTAEQQDNVMQNSLLVHKHLIIRAEAVKPPTDEEQLTNWLKEFIESINMKIMMGPYVKYCAMEGIAESQGLQSLKLLTQ